MSKLMTLVSHVDDMMKIHGEGSALLACSAIVQTRGSQMASIPLEIAS
jgi:hypothetical protein